MIRRVVVLIAAGALVFGACGSDDASDTGTGTSTTQLTLLPTTTAAPTTTALPTTTIEETTTTVVDTTTTVVDTTTTVVDPAAEALVLSGDGIGSAEFGADPDGVVSYIASFLGEPTNDSGWIDPLEVGACPGSEIRFVEWGVLTVVFGDVSNVVSGRRHFFSYTYGLGGEVGAPPVGLTTERGVTLGSRVIDVVAAYPGVTLNPEDEFSDPSFYVNDNLRGSLTGVEDDAIVTVIFGGVGCGG
jgi:hypothetical protein